MFRIIWTTFLCNFAFVVDKLVHCMERSSQNNFQNLSSMFHRINDDSIFTFGVNYHFKIEKNIVLNAA